MINKIKKVISSFLINPEVISPQTTDLQDTVVIITGARQGIGKAIAECLEKEGAKLVLLSRNWTKEDVIAYGKRGIECKQTDITLESEVKKAANEVVEKYGKIDVLINNAGVFLDKHAEDFSSEDFEKVMNTNIKGMFLLTKYCLPHMKKKKDGLIINMGSKISHNTNVSPKKTLYAMSKYAVEGFSLALQKEVKENGIRVTCLMPGTVNTFVSLKSKQYLSPYSLGFLIATIIKSKDVSFESIILQSVNQNL